jgi:hypothetical protein
MRGMPPFGQKNFHFAPLFTGNLDWNIVGDLLGNLLAANCRRSRRCQHDFWRVETEKQSGWPWEQAFIVGRIIPPQDVWLFPTPLDHSSPGHVPVLIRADSRMEAVLCAMVYLKYLKAALSQGRSLRSRTSS